jgi:hypothetical protein
MKAHAFIPLSRVFAPCLSASCPEYIKKQRDSRRHLQLTTFLSLP